MKGAKKIDGPPVSASKDGKIVAVLSSGKITSAMDMYRSISKLETAGKH